MAAKDAGNWSVLEYRPSGAVLDSIAKTLSVSVAEATNLDYDDELALVARLRGSEPDYSREFDYQQMTRGNVSLASNWVTTPDEIEDGLKEVDEYYGLRTAVI